MNTYWTDKRPNGQPIEAGTVCLVSDLQDGTHPQYTYGKTQEEVLHKIALNNMHAQVALQRRTQPANPQNPATPRPVAAPTRMTPDERMQAMAERDNPATAGAAMARLIKDDTGFDPEQQAMESWKRLAGEWADETPAFYNHLGNRTLLARTAGIRVGGRVGLITKQMLDECFAALQASGEIFDGPETPNNLEAFPDESPVRRVERQRGARFATGIPGNRLNAPQIVQPKTLKYTKEQIDRMSLAQSKRLIESDDKDYAAACDVYYPQTRQATA